MNNKGRLIQGTKSDKFWTKSALKKFRITFETFKAIVWCIDGTVPRLTDSRGNPLNVYTPRYCSVWNINFVRWKAEIVYPLIVLMDLCTQRTSLVRATARKWINAKFMTPEPRQVLFPGIWALLWGEIWGGSFGMRRQQASTHFNFLIMYIASVTLDVRQQAWEGLAVVCLRSVWPRKP